MDKIFKTGSFPLYYLKQTKFNVIVYIICIAGENEVLSKVLDKISTDYEQLKKNFDAQKCPKDDKILALRKTARALETENQLLHEEKTMIERETKRIRDSTKKN